MTVAQWKRVCFTLNNYSCEEFEKLKIICDKCDVFIIGKEKGKCGTPHLQGYVEFKSGKRLTTLKNYNGRCHWEKAKGDRLSNYKYCSKEGDFICKGFKENRNIKLLKKYENVVWKEWQQELLNVLEKDCDNDRVINWVYDFDGNSGKSFLSKYIVLKYNAIIGSGKKNDVFNQIKNWMDLNVDGDPKIIIIDLPRHNKEFLNYG